MSTSGRVSPALKGITHGSLPGDWLIVEDFKDPRIASKLAPFLGPPDVARFRFKNQTVEFRKAGEPDSIGVRVVDRD